MARTSSSRDRILNAAESVVAERGAAHMTLDAVAARARVSKGGLIYHFSSQRDLLRAMLNRFSRLMAARMEEVRATLPDDPNREIRTYILAWFGMGDQDRHTAGSLLAATTRDPTLLQVVRKKHSKMMARIVASAPHPERTQILALATEGVWMSELLGITLLSRGNRERIKQALLQCANNWEGGRTAAASVPRKPSGRSGRPAHAPRTSARIRPLK